MAMVHPSRMALVPQDRRDSESSRRGRPPSPLRRSPSADSNKDKDEFGRDRAHGRARDARGDRHGGDRDRDERRNEHGDRSRRQGQERDRARADDYFNDGETTGRRKRSRSRSVDKARDREREARREREKDVGWARRASPEYGANGRRSPEREREGGGGGGGGKDGEKDRVNGNEKAPWRQQENMYPNRGGRPSYGGGYGGGGADFMESRRQQREASSVTVWPPSPKGPTRVDSPTRDSKRHKKSHKRRHDDSESDTDSDDSEEERRRRERKERKKARKEKKEREREKDREREHRRHRSRSRRYSDDEDSDRERRKRQRRSQSRKELGRSATRTKSPEQHPPLTPDEDEWVEKPVADMATAFSPPAQNTPANTMPPPPVPTSKGPAGEDDSDDEVGPQPVGVKTTSSRKVDERQYGGALLRGEGSAMAAFLKDGTDLRIPRRGEIGLSSDEIAAYEGVGYVMSGSRHRRMNAVRMRKENQVISAEERRGILKLQAEERERREVILREEFQQLVQDNLKSQGATK